MANEVDVTSLIDGLVEVMGILLTAFILVIDTMLGRLWDFIVRMLSINHLGQTPSVVLLTLGLLFCIWLYVVKFWK